MSGRSVSSFNFFVLSGSRFLSTRFSVLLKFQTPTLRVRRSSGRGLPTALTPDPRTPTPSSAVSSRSLLDAAPSQDVAEPLTSRDGDDHVRCAMLLAAVVVAVKGVVVALYTD